MKWKDAWKHFAQAASALSTAWEHSDIDSLESKEYEKFQKEYADVFDMSFDEISFSIGELNQLAQHIK